MQAAQRAPRARFYAQKSAVCLWSVNRVAGSRANLRWNAPGVPEDVRKGFAIETGNGCHKNETGTNSFQHVTGRRAGATATLSSFLTATELPRRTTDLLAVLDPEGNGTID